MAELLRTEEIDAVIGALPVAVAVYGRDTRLAGANAAFAALWGFDPGWLARHPSFAEVVRRLAETRQLPEQADARAYQDALAQRFETLKAKLEETLHLPDGRSLLAVTAPRPGGGLVTAYHDLTDRLASERRVNEAQAVRRALIDRLDEGLAVFGADGRLGLANPAFARLWDLADDVLAARPHLTEIYDRVAASLPDGADLGGGRDAFVSACLARSAGGTRLARADGTVLDFAHAPLPDGAALVTFADVTDGARVESALRERAEAMEAANRLKSEFLANLSHEVRTPLNTIVGFAEILTGDYFGELNARQREYAGGIASAAATLAGLVGDILDLANIEAGLLDLDLDSFDLHNCLASVLGLVRERARHKKVKLDFKCKTDIGWIVADERRLKQAVLHLLGNALTFTASGGTVKLQARRKDDTVEIAIADTGVGIPKADKARVFEGFEAARAAGLAPGAGLGLTLVKSYIELHGGTVEIASAPNKGTRVTCTLPAG